VCATDAERIATAEQADIVPSSDAAGAAWYAGEGKQQLLNSWSISLFSRHMDAYVQAAAA
jgi:hypothetical protein